MRKCLIIGKEITEEECEIAIQESYLDKNTKKLQKKFKRIVCWKSICRECEFHKQNK